MSRTIDRLLRPPPKPRVAWYVHYTTVDCLHAEWPGRRHVSGEWRGVKLRYVGHATWSECHHVYRVAIPRDLRAALDTDPVGSLFALAARIDVEIHHLCLELGRIDLPAVPHDLCWRCWQRRRRSFGRTYLQTHTTCDGSPYTTSSTVCEEHLPAVLPADWIELP